jgi:hypothetical protein
LMPTTSSIFSPLVRRIKARAGFASGPAPQDLVRARAPVSLDLQTRLGDVRLFTVIATLGAPLEVTAANLAIETFLPMDTEGAERLRELARTPEPAGTPA